jgi:hypothetical protein
LGFEKWTKKMSKNQKREKVLKKMFLKSESDHNALKFVFEFRKVVTMIFLGKNVGVFFVKTRAYFSLALKRHEC